MNKLEQGNADSPASLSRIWINSTIPALLFSMVETFFRLQSPVFDASFADISQMALLFVFGYLLWTLLLLPAGILI